MAKKVTIQTHFNELWVRPLPGGGSGLHDVSMLNPERAYRVLATFTYRYRDASTTPAFLLQDEDDRIIEKACCRFRVSEVT